MHEGALLCMKFRSYDLMSRLLLSCSQTARVRNNAGSWCTVPSFECNFQAAMMLYGHA